MPIVYFVTTFHTENIVLKMIRGKRIMEFKRMVQRLESSTLTVDFLLNILFVYIKTTRSIS